MPRRQLIRWPENYSPEKTAVHVHNEIDIHAEPERVWAWLVRAMLWPSWYANSQNVAIEGGEKDLCAGAKFTWKTFGISLHSRVVEFEPSERLG